MPHLKILDLRDNKIEIIPKEIAFLQNLIRLDLSNNTILSIPNSLATLAHLTSLQLDGNPIRSIRRDIIQGGTQRILRILRDRSKIIAEDDNQTIMQPNKHSLIGDSVFPDRYTKK